MDIGSEDANGPGFSDLRLRSMPIPSAQLVIGEMIPAAVRSVLPVHCLRYLGKQSAALVDLPSRSQGSVDRQVGRQNSARQCPHR